jgi:hypothetical protein
MRRVGLRVESFVDLAYFNFNFPAPAPVNSKNQARCRMDAKMLNG